MKRTNKERAAAVVVYRRSQPASTGHAAPTSTGPLEPTIVRVRVAVGHQLVAPQLAAVVAVLEHQPPDLVAGELVAAHAVGAGEAALDHLQAEAGPQRALRRSSPTIRGKPSSGCSGLVSQ